MSNKDDLELYSSKEYYKGFADCMRIYNLERRKFESKILRTGRNLSSSKEELVQLIVEFTRDTASAMKAYKQAVSELRKRKN